MTYSIPLDWWRGRAATPDLAASMVGAEPQGGRLAFWALVAFTIVLFLEPQKALPVFGPMRINLIIAMIAIVAHVFAPRAAAMRFPMELRLVLSLLACAVVSIPGSYWPGGSVEALGEYLKTIVVFYLLGQHVCSLGRIRVMMWTLVLVCGLIALTALQNYAAGVFMGGNRIQGYGPLAANPNDLALTLNLFLPMTVALAVVAPRASMRVVAWGLSGLAVGGVIVTYSRGGFLTLLVEGLLILALLLKRRAAKTLGAAALCAALALAMAPAGYMDRLGTILNIESDSTGSAQSRWSDTVTSMDYVMRHPVLGAGLGQSALALNEARGAFWAVVHNAYLNYGVDLGAPGLVLFVGLVVTCFRSARRIERLEGAAVPGELKVLASGVRISLSGFIVAAFFHPVGYSFYFFYLAGLSVALKAAAVRQFGVRVPS